MSGFALKLIALIFMAIDHINTFLGTRSVYRYGSPGSAVSLHRYFSIY